MTRLGESDCGFSGFHLDLVRQLDRGPRLGDAAGELAEHDWFRRNRLEETQYHRVGSISRWRQHVSVPDRTRLASWRRARETTFAPSAGQNVPQCHVGVILLCRTYA